MENETRQDRLCTNVEYYAKFENDELDNQYVNMNIIQEHLDADSKKDLLDLALKKGGNSIDSADSISKCHKNTYLEKGYTIPNSNAMLRFSSETIGPNKRLDGVLNGNITIPENQVSHLYFEEAGYPGMKR